ncbi:hypothetical protein SAMN06272755_2922 [Picosynechococcus sp. OG1]|nr:hypothetical protein SAMN06272755_2922 [Picosynechococcus sp. OG1]SMQ83177.1 hypothetical protein SAMN06272774_2198 [Synechococcus sp. 7002]
MDKYGDLVLYPLLGTNSKRALQRVRRRGYKPYHYRPRARLLYRLAEEMDWTIDRVYNQLLKERSILLRMNREVNNGDL